MNRKSPFVPQPGSMTSPSSRAAISTPSPSPSPSPVPSPLPFPLPLARRRWLGGASALALAWVAAPRVVAAQSRDSPDLPLPALGSTIALPDLTLLDGTTVEAAERRGRTTVLYWWASWCPFCAEQSPLIDKLWRDQQDKGLLVLGLSIDKTAKVAADHLSRKGYGFPSAWLSPELAKHLPKPKGLPVTVVLDAAGKVLAAESGQMFAEDVAELARWAPGNNEPAAAGEASK